MQVIVPMAPFGKARPRVTRRGTYMPRKYEKQRQDLRRLFGPVDVTTPVALEVVAARPVPQSWSNRKREATIGDYCTAGPDSDNIAGAVMDSLFEDDSIVVDVRCIKIWGREGYMIISLKEAQ